MAAKKKSIGRKASKPKGRKADKPTSATPREVVLNKALWRFSGPILREMGLTQSEFEAVRSFRDLKQPDRIKASREVITNLVINAGSDPDLRFPLAVAESGSLLKGYATLDDLHRAEISRLINRITLYLRDATRKRPFNALMLAAPGAGKSHFIKQLAEKMRDERVQAVTFNMATMQSPDDMAQPIDELRNVKVNDRYPLLFLDEFDSDTSRYPSLLPLLWDGELQIGHRDLKLGKAVLILAGSNPDLPKAMAQSAKMGLETDGTDTNVSGKLIDLLSRINGGVINIPDLDLRTENRDRRVDKVCVAISLLRVRFGPELLSVPRSLLRFVAHTVFRYGVRSIAHLVDLIDSRAFEKGTLDVEKLDLPLGDETALTESSLSLHLIDKDKGFGIANRWQEFNHDKKMLDLNPNRAQFWPVLEFR